MAKAGLNSVLGRISVLGGLALVALGGAVYAASRVTGPAGDPWYDATSLLVSLRPEARVNIAHALGVIHTEDLTFYDLDLSYDAGASRFSLGEDVWFTNTTPSPLPDLVFRVYANAAPPDGGPQVHFVSGSCVGDPRCALSMVTASALHVQLGAPLAPGGRVRLQLFFAGALTHIDSSRTNFLTQGMEGMKAIFGGGSGGGDYGLLAVGDGIVSFANFYPVLARRIGSTWETDEVSKLGDLGSDNIANFRAKIELPPHAKLAVTGVVTSDTPASDGRREVHVAAAAIRDFALVFGDAMEASTRDVYGVHVRSYYLAADRAAGVRVLDIASHALEDFERRFGPYPYADYNVSEAAIVGGAGGVEFSGMVTAASMFYRPATTPQSSGGAASGDMIAGLMAQLGGLGGPGMTSGMLEFVVAHETAHQWWHGLVGSDSRDHPYVDEALAQYSSLLYLEDRYGAARAEKDGNANVKMNYQTMRMIGKPDAPADQPVASFTAGVQYAGVIYGKAPYFYKAVRDAIGDAAFFAAMKEYVVRYRFQEAPALALVDLFAAGREGKVRPLQRRWLEEMHGDEDLGKLDMGSMLGGLGGAGGGLGTLGGLGVGGSDLGDLEQVMKMLQGAGGSLPGGAGGAGGAGGGGGEPDVGEILKMLGGGSATPPP
jgi:hypothetical protein